MTDDQHKSDGKQHDPLDSVSDGQPAEELRYDGPITFDDDGFDDEDDAPARRTFLTTAIIFAAVVVIVGSALWLRSRSSDTADALAGLHGMTPPPAATDGPDPAGDPLAAPREEPPAPTPEAGETEAANLDYRAVPDIPQEVEPTFEAPVESPPPPAPVPPAIERPAPRPAALTGTGDAPAGATADPAEMARLARDGRVPEAAAMGATLARSGNPTQWTLQVLLACRPETVSRAFQKVRDPDLRVYPTTFRGKNCYRLCWGRFASEASARDAIASVPAYFRGAGKPRAISNAQLMR
ncbi:MAG: hypothetical protein Q9Q13_10635 [Acidobacteriota bacterium]|nr:hypothetical protein [Acidobacteriota bacterium]